MLGAWFLVNVLEVEGKMWICIQSWLKQIVFMSDVRVMTLCNR